MQVIVGLHGRFIPVWPYASKQRNTWLWRFPSSLSSIKRVAMTYLFEAELSLSDTYGKTTANNGK